MASKKLIILDKLSGGQYRAVLWADVPEKQRKFFSNPNATSAYKDASEAELAALRDGRLADIAPTLLALLGLPQPAAMTGQSLLG